ncbi:MAG: futalosine hydrolase [Bacteroidetes bacterium]|nr:futalosine hydrolase [Bacteroidota bacterium]
MKILIVSATKKEIASLLRISDKKTGDSFFTSSFGKHTLDFLITGVGMTSTAFHLGKLLSNKKYDLAINAGIAGSFRKNIPPGTVVNVTEDCFADFGAEDGEKFLTAEEIKLVQSSKFKVSRRDSFGASSKFKNKTLNKLPKAKAITVNTVHGNASSIKKVVKKFNPDIESMEGAAFFLACMEEKIPCIQVRAISNYVENSK